MKKLVGNGGKGLGKDDVHFRVKRPGADTLLLMGGILMTAFLLWFAVNSQISARPVARALLQGMALSLGQAIDYMAARDPSFKTLADFRYRDIAYFALIDRSGRVRFHQNPELAGEIVADDRYLPAFSAAAPVENRIRLGTGEEAYECHLPLHLPGETLVLRLVLHTWQADQIINRARTGATILLTLTVSAWVLGFLLVRLQKRDARRREQMARQEQMAQLGEMGAVLAHEVRTPLSGIKGYAQLLGERMTDERSRRFAALIAQEAVRLEGLVNDLLDYARQDDPGDGCTLLDEELLNNAWGMMSGHADVQMVKLELSISPGAQVACRPDRLRQLLINLFSNALQAIASEGTVRVSVTEGREMVTLKVQDTGADATLVTLPLSVFLYPTDKWDITLEVPLLYLSSKSDSGVIVTNSGGAGRGRAAKSAGMASTTTVQESGIGDISMTTGWTLFREGERNPKVRPTLYLKVPTGDLDHGLGTGTVEASPGLSVSKWLESVQLFGEGAYIFQNSGSNYAGQNYVSYLGGAGIQATERLFVSALAKGSSPRSEGAEAQAEGRISLNFMHSRRISWNFYGSAGFTDASPDYGGGMAMIYRF